MNRARFLSLIACGFLWSIGIGQATPPETTRVDERFFGAGSETYAVLRTVTENLGSYYRSRVITTLIERAKVSGEVRSEVLLLNREEIVDADYDGPGKAPVKVVIHAKNEEERFATLLERWPQQGTRLSPEEMAHFKIGPDGIRFDERLEVISGKALEAAWRGEAVSEAGWTVEEIIDLGGNFCVKLASKEEDGDSASFWASVSPEVTTQVRAYRKMQPVYLVAGTYDSKEKALEQAVKWNTDLKAKKYARFTPEIWAAVSSGAGPSYLIVEANSTSLIESGKATEAETYLQVHFQTIGNAGLREWIPVPW